MFGCSLKQAWGDDFNPEPQVQPGSKKSQNRAYQLPPPAPERHVERPVVVPPPGGLQDPAVQKLLLYLVSGACLVVLIDKLK